MTTEHSHPTPRQYVKIALLLAALTGMEVSLYYIERGTDAIGTSLTTPLLLGLSALKFLAVIGYYMHLRFEKNTLSRFFTIGFVLALTLYGIVLAAFGVMSGAFA